MIMSNGSSERKTCGTCVFSGRRKAHGGVQVVDPDAPWFCFLQPPGTILVPNGHVMTIRPMVGQEDPACREWRRMEM